jgi:hypothetical protein
MKRDTLAIHAGSPVHPVLLPYAHQTIEPDDVSAVTAALTDD